jgi:Flp pilus assembly protein CpaB
MFRRSPRAALLWAGAFLVAGVTAAIVISSISSLRHQDSAYGRLHSIVIARRDLPLGTRISRPDASAVSHPLRTR